MMKPGRGGAVLSSVLVLGLLVAGVLWLRTWPPVATVASDSMRPSFAAGDLLLLRSVSEPAVGDVVIVPVPHDLQEERGYPPQLAHRVHSIDSGLLTTHGDALGDPDPFTVPVGVVSQRAVGSVPFLGHVLAFLRTPVGMLWWVGGLMLLALRQRPQEDQAATVEDLELLQVEIASTLARHQVAVERAVAQPSPVPESRTGDGAPAPDRALTGRSPKSTTAARAGEASLQELMRLERQRRAAEPEQQGPKAKPGA